jgi:hypothetical protein
MGMVGIFAGRGDVILAMGMALLFGVWAGWQLRRLKEWIIRRGKHDENISG